MSCIKCGVVVNDSKFLRCDGCNRPIHVACSELTAAELKCFELRPNNKRRIKYICIECEQGLHQIPKILKLINDLKEEIRELRETRVDKPCVVAPAPDSYNQVMANEQMIAEMLERSKRSCNIIIHGGVEAGNTRQDQIREDAVLVQAILHECEIADHDVKPIRLGKFDPTREKSSRPIRMRLSSSECVPVILRKFKKLKSSGKFKQLSLSPDRTPQQVSVYKSVKMELERRLSDGETNLRIKYFNGLPTIIQSNSEN